MKIDLLILKAVTEELCDRYVQLNGRYLDTEIDLFWDVPMDLDRVANLFKVISFEIERGSEKCMM